MQKVNRLKEILNERNLTNSWLARQLGVDPTTVSKWCTNSSQPDILTFLKIASLLHLDVSALYDEKVISDFNMGSKPYELWKKEGSSDISSDATVMQGIEP